ncbi:MAG TPA: glycosyltransferase family 39 protein [Candidatus Dormibacteraeota bacterium]
MASRAVTLPRSEARPLWLLAGGGALVVLLAHLPVFAHRLLDGDEGVYGSIAALMNLGGHLYADGGVDNKPPGIFWTYAATFALFGQYQMNAIHALALVVTAATSVALFLIGRSTAGPRAGVLAAIFYGILTAAGNPRLLAANTELFMTLPLTVSFLLTVRRQWLLSGLLLVVAGAFKQVAAAQVLLFPAALVLITVAGERPGATLRFGAGILIGLVAGAAVLAATGSLAGFWRWSVETLAGYAAGNWNPGVVVSRARDSLVPFVLDMAVLWIAALALIVRRRRLTTLEKLAIAWFGVSFLGSIAGGHWSWHYFIQVMAPLALLAALAVDRALETDMRRWVAAVVGIGLLVPAAWWAVYDTQADPLTYDWSPPVAQHEAVAAYINEHSSPGDRVFVWGDWAALYIESDRVMAGRFPGFLRGFARTSGLRPNNWDTAPDVWSELQSDLAAHPPALIVDTAAAGWSDFAGYPMSDYPVLETLVTSSYHRIATVDGVVIYARNA